MNPIAVEALAAVVRWALTLAAGYFIKLGIWDAAHATRYVMAASLPATTALLMLTWSIRQKIASRRKLLTAGSLSQPSSEAVIERIVARGNAPSVFTAFHDVPRAP